MECTPFRPDTRASPEGLGIILGSPYTAGETRALAREIGLKPCTTPIESPQSNGMAEALVKTIKRDYARVSARPDAASVLCQLEVAPE